MKANHFFDKYVKQNQIATTQYSVLLKLKYENFEHIFNQLR